MAEHRAWLAELVVKLGSSSIGTKTAIRAQQHLDAVARYSQQQRLAQQRLSRQC